MLRSKVVVRSNCDVHHRSGDGRCPHARRRPQRRGTLSSIAVLPDDTSMDATSELAEYISQYEEASGSVSRACATPPPGAPRDVGGHSPRWQLLAEAARSR
eukprot:COSAG04_NODE_22281_length_357_cov_1.193798_1_plen_100_part_01